MLAAFSYIITYNTRSLKFQSANKMLRVLSLGGGVQSSTLALMMATGDLPSPDCAIFADTGAEPRGVYDWLTWLEQQLPFPVHRVSKGNLREHLLDASCGQRYAGIPLHTESSGPRRAGMLKRQCTSEFKVEPITQKLRELVGLKTRQRGPDSTLVVQYIGISTDEIIRMKPSRHRWIAHRWPLIDLGMTRGHCLEWLRKHRYPLPGKSACTFCPYRDNRSWRDMKANDEESWRDAVRIDEAVRNGVRGTRERLYVHRSLKPLISVDFRQAEDFGQIDLFGNECEGLCGV
jgi:hypothetical protein